MEICLDDLATIQYWINITVQSHSDGSLQFLLLHSNSILDVDILSAVGQTQIYLATKVTFL